MAAACSRISARLRYAAAPKSIGAFPAPKSIGALPPAAALDQEASRNSRLVRTRSCARAAESYRGEIERAMADVRGWLRAGWRVLLVTEGHGPAERVAEVLRAEEMGNS